MYKELDQATKFDYQSSRNIHLSWGRPAVYTCKFN